MATREFVKFYSVNPNRIDEHGNLDPDAGLYPGYGRQYGFKDVNEKDLPEHFGQPIEYDNSSNRHPDRRVTLYNVGGDIGRTHTVGPNVKRGFSVNAYRGMNKRPVGFDKTDTFDMWKRDSKDYDQHYSTAIDPAKRTYDFDDIDGGPYVSTAGYLKHLHEDNPNADSKVGTLDFNDAVPQAKFSAYMRGYFGDKIEKSADSFRRRYRKGARNRNDLITIPVIVEADDEDVININDVLNGNYDPTRDYQEEVQLKRIRGRRLPKGLFVNEPVLSEQMQDVLYEIDEYKDQYVQMLGYIMTALGTLPNVNSANNEICKADYTTGYTFSGRDAEGTLYTHALAGLMTMFIVYTVNNFNAKCLPNVPDYFGARSTYVDALDSVISVLSNAVDTLKGDAGYDAGKLSDGTMQQLRGYGRELGMYYDKLYEALDNLAGCVYADSAAHPVATYDGSILRNIQDWFPYDSDRTYSDERMKDIYDCLSDDGCTDINLSDNHIKQVTEDFRKFMRGKDDNSAILNGLRELGQ